MNTIYNGQLRPLTPQDEEYNDTSNSENWTYHTIKVDIEAPSFSDAYEALDFAADTLDMAIHSLVIDEEKTNSMSNPSAPIITNSPFQKGKAPLSIPVQPKLVNKSKKFIAKNEKPTQSPWKNFGTT